MQSEHAVETEMHEDKEEAVELPNYPWDDIQDEVDAELIRATEKFGPFGSPHEGYSIILEELDELWEKVKNPPDMDKTEKRPDGFTEGQWKAVWQVQMKKEAVQVAAMAVRFALDCCDGDWR